MIEVAYTIASSLMFHTFYSSTLIALLKLNFMLDVLWFLAGRFFFFLKDNRTEYLHGALMRWKGRETKRRKGLQDIDTLFLLDFNQ